MSCGLQTWCLHCKQGCNQQRTKLAYLFGAISIILPTITIKKQCQLQNVQSLRIIHQIALSISLMHVLLGHRLLYNEVSNESYYSNGHFLPLIFSLYTRPFLLETICGKRPRIRSDKSLYEVCQILSNHFQPIYFCSFL